MENFYPLLDKYMAALAAKQKERFDTLFPNLPYPTFSVEKGTKFIRVVITNTNGQRFAHCFIQIDNGDILKAESWKKPAKGVRGNIANATYPLLGAEFYSK